MTTPRVTVPVADLERVRDLLMERIYGSPARSPAHNARLEVEAMLSAAPAPEGGVVKDWDAIRSHPCYDEHQPGCDCAALATRGEAPAEAGERNGLAAELDRLADCEGGMRGGSERAAETMRQAAKCLRAQPQAREDAQPVGWLRAVDEEMVCAHLGVADAEDGFETAKKKLASLIQWNIAVATDPSVGDLPAPDALRVAVEASSSPLEIAVAALRRINDPSKTTTAISARVTATEALSALQAEQGAK